MVVVVLVTMVIVVVVVIMVVVFFHSSSGIIVINLGITISKKPKHTKQCTYASKRANISFIARNFEYKIRETILSLCNSLLKTHLENMVQVWSPSFENGIELLASQ